MDIICSFYTNSNFRSYFSTYTSTDTRSDFINPISNTIRRSDDGSNTSTNTSSIIRTYRCSEWYAKHCTIIDAKYYAKYNTD